MPAEAASWKGYLKLSLVSCAIAVYPTTTGRERITFHNINTKTGNRIRIQMVDEATREPVERDEIVRGYEVGKGEYIQVEDAELENVALESTRTIDIEQFVPREEIDPVYRAATHYIVPDDKVAIEAFSVIRDAMAKRGTVGIGRLVINRRERVVMLEPRGEGILATTLRYPYEVRSDDSAFERITGVEPSAELVEAAERIVEEKRGKFDPRKFEDRYQVALKKVVEAKQKGGAPKPAKAAEPGRPTNVINLMDALRSSIAAEQAGRGKARPADRRPAAKSRSRSKAAAPAKKAKARR